MVAAIIACPLPALQRRNRVIEDRDSIDAPVPGHPFEAVFDISRKGEADVLLVTGKDVDAKAAGRDKMG